jgi:hypothetical protein
MVWILLRQYRAKQRTNMKAVGHLGGHAIVQAVSHRRPGFEPRSVHVEFGGQRHGGRFSPRASVSPANSHSTDCSTFIFCHPEFGTIGQLVADVPNGLSLTPPQETKNKTPWMCQRIFSWS